MDDDYYLINLVSIIVDDFQKYPNNKLNNIISNLENFFYIMVNIKNLIYNMYLQKKILK